MPQLRRTTSLLAGLRNSDRHEDTINARPIRYIRTLEGSLEPAADADGRVLPSAGEDADVRIRDGANSDGFRIAGSDRIPRDGAVSGGIAGAVDAALRNPGPD